MKTIIPAALLILSSCSMTPVRAQASPETFTIYAKLGMATFAATQWRQGNRGLACKGWSDLLFIEMRDGTSQAEINKTRELVSRACY
jgi:hypothetical protein